MLTHCRLLLMNGYISAIYLFMIEKCHLHQQYIMLFWKHFWGVAAWKCLLIGWVRLWKIDPRPCLLRTWIHICDYVLGWSLSYASEAAKQTIVLVLSVCVAVCLCVLTKTGKLLMRNRYNLVGISVMVNHKNVRFWWFLTLTFVFKSYFS